MEGVMATYIAWVFETKPTEGHVAYGVEAADYADAVEKARAAFGPRASPSGFASPAGRQVPCFEGLRFREGFEGFFIVAIVPEQ